MTINQFAAECGQRTIDPAIALENENIRQALADKNDQRVIEILNTEF